MVETKASYSLTDGCKWTEMILNRHQVVNNLVLFECLEDEIMKKKPTDMCGSCLKTGDKNTDLQTRSWGCTTFHMNEMGFGPCDVENYAAMRAQWISDFKKGHPDFDITITGMTRSAGGGYTPDNKMTAEEARKFHLPNMTCLKRGGVDRVQITAINYYEEAVGAILAAKDAGVPVSCSFTV